MTMDGDEFRGLVTLYRIHELREPLWKEYNGRKLCLADRGYLWMQHFPRGEHFVVTTMFDDKNRVVQWYIDICKTQGLTDQQVPWFDDLYLDVVVLPSGEVFLLDEDELEDAVRKGVVSNKDAALARKTAGRLLSAIRNGRFRYFTLSLKHRKALAGPNGEVSES
jgi:predicted RNA-binding protein associated with RNAse of E/G family